MTYMSICHTQGHTQISKSVCVFMSKRKERENPLTLSWNPTKIEFGDTSKPGYLNLNLETKEKTEIVSMYQRHEAIQSN